MKKSLVFIFIFLFAFIGFIQAKSVRVRGGMTKNGHYRQSHYRTSPDHSKFNNWSTKGNVNPHTGKRGTKKIR